MMKWCSKSTLKSKGEAKFGLSPITNHWAHLDAVQIPKNSGGGENTSGKNPRWRTY